MPSFPRLTPRFRRRELGRRAHFRRTAVLAAIIVLIWGLATIGFVAQFWLGGIDLRGEALLWIAVPLLALIIFDRLQSGLDRSCGGGER